MEQPQTSPNQSPLIARQREHELQITIFNNARAPGMPEILEYARLRVAAAHANYLKGSPPEECRQKELAWLKVVDLLTNEPKIKEVKNG